MTLALSALWQLGSTQPVPIGSLPWSPQRGSPMSARHSRQSPSSPVITRSLCSSCCLKSASSPLTSLRILSSVKVRHGMKTCLVSPWLFISLRNLGPIFIATLSPPWGGLSVVLGWTSTSTSSAQLFGCCTSCHGTSISFLRPHLAGLAASPQGAPWGRRVSSASPELLTGQLQGPEPQHVEGRLGSVCDVHVKDDRSVGGTWQETSRCWWSSLCSWFRQEVFASVFAAVLGGLKFNVSLCAVPVLMVCGVWRKVGAWGCLCEEQMRVAGAGWMQWLRRKP